MRSLKFVFYFYGWLIFLVAQRAAAQTPQQQDLEQNGLAAVESGRDWNFALGGGLAVGPSAS